MAAPPPSVHGRRVQRRRGAPHKDGRAAPPLPSATKLTALRSGGRPEGEQAPHQDGRHAHQPALSRESGRQRCPAVRWPPVGTPSRCAENRRRDGLTRTNMATAPPAGRGAVCPAQRWPPHSAGPLNRRSSGQYTPSKPHTCHIVGSRRTHSFFLSDPPAPPHSVSNRFTFRYRGGEPAQGWGEGRGGREAVHVGISEDRPRKAGRRDAPRDSGGVLPTFT
ncbi:hypothetical protein chiPu_0026129 [Chiloscyllium punctatum]|uniref:Uncharacterized protein n=1 Tax=Chiloscyllium punctatum TaxID=137246 RepID=A0A401THU3_CHIPU|nr:hypothetical protein [Chiloscyllium punctatum]